MRTENFEIIEIGVEKGVDLGYGFKDSMLPNPVLQEEGIILSFNIV